MAFGLLCGKFTSSEVEEWSRCILRGKQRGEQALIRSLHFLTVYSNLASDENEEQINYHNSFTLQQTLCEDKSFGPGEIGRAEYCHNYSKIRGNGDTPEVKSMSILQAMIRRILDSCTRHPPTLPGGVKRPVDTHPSYSSIIGRDCCLVELVAEFGGVI